MIPQCRDAINRVSTDAKKHTMTEKYKNKYRIPSARLQDWDYGWNAHYFVTICTKDKKYHMGNIVDENMHLSQTGKLVHQLWCKIPGRFLFALLDVFVVMPNHIHGIIVIDKADGDGDDNRRDAMDNGRDAINDTRDAMNRVSTTGGVTGNKNPMLHENLSRIIRWYKGRVSFELRKINPEFGWQPRFHDHIIRNQKSFEAIQAYIINNPAKWHEDTYYEK